MAYRVTFEPEHKLVTVIAEGAGNMSVALESMRDLRTDRRFQSDYGILCDLTKEEFEPDAIERVGLSSVLQGFFAGQRLAFVTSGSRYLETLQFIILQAEQKVDAKIFGDIPAAKAWLMSEH